MDRPRPKSLGDQNTIPPCSRSRGPCSDHPWAPSEHRPWCLGVLAWPWSRVFDAGGVTFVAMAEDYRSWRAVG